MTWIGWLIIGAIAGWLAGKLMRGGGFGLLVNIIVGLIGSVVGGWIFGALGFATNVGVWGSLITSFLGAVILLWVISLFKRS